MDRAIKVAIKSFEDPPLDPSERRLLYGKLAELNRVSFGEAVRSFQTDYSLDVSDLWEITGKGSLSDVRNRVIHGDTFTHEQMNALVTAKFQMQWHLERMLLAILGWPISQSGVRKDAIAAWTPYHDTVTARNKLAT